MLAQVQILHYITAMGCSKALTAPAAPGIQNRSIVMQAITSLRAADKIAKSLGLVRGKGTYNGQAFWVRPGNPAIITRERLAEMAGLV